MKKVNNTICGLTESQIQDLKEQHGFLIIGTVKQGDEEYNTIFKEPSFKAPKQWELSLKIMR